MEHKHQYKVLPSPNNFFVFRCVFCLDYKYVNKEQFKKAVLTSTVDFRILNMREFMKLGSTSWAEWEKEYQDMQIRNIIAIAQNNINERLKSIPMKETLWQKVKRVMCIGRRSSSTLEF